MGEIVTVICEAAWIVTVAVPSVPSTMDVAITVTVGGLGTNVGAVYNPVEEMDPQPKPMHPLPERLQLTI